MMPSHLHVRCRTCTAAGNYHGMDGLECAGNATADGWQITRSPTNLSLIILCPGCAENQTRNLFCLLVDHYTDEPDP